MPQKKTGMNESVLGWFKRVHPEELWAVEKMPPALKFGDVLKSMEGGLGMGDAATCSDTMTREMILDRLAELTGETFRELVDKINVHRGGSKITIQAIVTHIGTIPHFLRYDIFNIKLFQRQVVE